MKPITPIFGSNTQRLLSGLVLAVLGVITPLQAQTHAADYAVNQRQPIQVTPLEHAHLLTEMNAFMRAIHDIQTALVAEDMELVAQIATTMGPKKGGHDAVGKAVHDKLPPDWFALAKPTHQNFLAIAKAAQQPSSVKAVLGAVAKTTAQCVSCHASYRLTTNR